MYNVMDALHGCRAVNFEFTLPESLFPQDKLQLYYLNWVILLGWEGTIIRYKTSFVCARNNLPRLGNVGCFFPMLVSPVVNCPSTMQYCWLSVLLRGVE